jgi:hypothetical protein
MADPLGHTIVIAMVIVVAFLWWDRRHDGHAVHHHEPPLRFSKPLDHVHFLLMEGQTDGPPKGRTGHEVDDAKLFWMMMFRLPASKTTSIIPCCLMIVVSSSIKTMPLQKSWFWKLRKSKIVGRCNSLPPLVVLLAAGNCESTIGSSFGHYYTFFLHGRTKKSCIPNWNEDSQIEQCDVKMVSWLLLVDPIVIMAASRAFFGSSRLSSGEE